MVAIIDYGLGNLASVQKSLNYLGIKNTITNNVHTINKSSSILLPGVGSYAQGMKNLKEKKLDLILKKEVIDNKKKFLGICLGMQLIFEKGYEPIPTMGLGWIKGEVKKIQSNNLRIPHLGWNNVCFNGNFSEDNINCNYYFIHSFHVIPKNKKVIESYFNYGQKMVASIRKNNIYATQFHPEKSQESGLTLLKNFFQNA